MEEIMKFVVFILTVLAIVCVLSGVLFGTVWFASLLAEKSCLESYSNYDVEWGFFSGCRIEWDGKMTPIDIIREIN